jgi:hypothetical protein
VEDRHDLEDEQRRDGREHPLRERLRREARAAHVDREGEQARTDREHG